MAVRYPEFQAQNAEVLAINVDSVHDHKVWHETELMRMVEGGIPFPILADRGGSIGRLYGVYDEPSGKTFRSTFLIDPQGKVLAAEGITSEVGRSPAEVLRLLLAHQTLYQTGMGVPCSWQNGDATIDLSFPNAGQIWRQWRPEQPPAPSA
jgi:alkyl hydroperoxide reductase subunit AhpC